MPRSAAAGGWRGASKLHNFDTTRTQSQRGTNASAHPMGSRPPAHTAAHPRRSYRRMYTVGGGAQRMLRTSARNLWHVATTPATNLCSVAASKRSKPSSSSKSCRRCAHQRLTHVHVPAQH
jgi:hypothetical protein